MRVDLAYGEGALALDLPDGIDVTVVRSIPTPGLGDEGAALREALQSPLGCPPLRALDGDGGPIAVVVSDATRPAPTSRLLPPILEALGPVADVQLIVATGTHRPSSPPELERMLGAEVARAYPIFQHDARDSSTLRPLEGLASERPIWLNRRYLDARVRVLTGLVEPHFFAGFSGGPKAVLPGIADRESILSNHGARNLEHPGAVWGVTEGNPIYEEMMRVALRSGPSFTVNVTTNPAGAITGVFAGSLTHVHRAAVRECRRATLRRVDGPFDIVITSNSGYPLDLDLYQGIKGVSAAARIVRPGGAILLVAECRDGIPEGSGYAEVLRAADSPRALLEIARSPHGRREGAWQAHLQALVQEKAQVFVHSGCLSPSQIESAHLSPAVDLEATASRLLEGYGPRARVAVLPEGPRTIPSLPEPSPAPSHAGPYEGER